MTQTITIAELVAMRDAMLGIARLAGDFDMPAKYMNQLMSLSEHTGLLNYYINTAIEAAPAVEVQS